MCVAQYRDYVNAYSFKERKDLKKEHKIIEKYGSFYDNKRERLYVLDNSKMKALVMNNNEYAVAN